MSLVSGLEVAVVGASLGGLSVANVLRTYGAVVTVYECFGSGFHSRGGALGAVDVGLLQQIRNDKNKGYRAIRGHGHFYGSLWEYLYEGIPEGSVKFSVDVVGVEMSHERPRLGFSVKGENTVIWQAFDLIIGADGGKSTIRQYVTDSKPRYAGYTLWRGLVPVEGVDGPPSGSKTVNGVHYETLGFPVKLGPKGQTMWNCGVYMAMPEAEVEAPVRNRQIGASAMRTVPEWFVPFTEAAFGSHNAEFWRACAEKGKVSPHAVWELASDRVVNGRVALLGDAAHMASPRTGAGAYTAMTDAVVLRQAIEQAHSIEEALAMYNRNTVERGEALYRRSRQAASYFCPPNATIVSPQLVLEKLRPQATGNAHSKQSQRTCDV